MCLVPFTTSRMLFQPWWDAPARNAPVWRYTSGKRTRHGLPVGSAPVTGDESGYYGEWTMVNSAHKCGDRAPIPILLDINLYWLVVYNQHEYSVHRTDMNLSCL